MSRILICDDEPAARGLWEHALQTLKKSQKSKRKWKIVRSLSDALNEAQTGGYDMFFFDMQNPGSRSFSRLTTPYDCAQEIRDLQPGAILVAYSATPPEFYSDEAREYFDYVLDGSFFYGGPSLKYTNLGAFFKEHLI